MKPSPVISLPSDFYPVTLLRVHFFLVGAGGGSYYHWGPLATRGELLGSYPSPPIHLLCDLGHVIISPVCNVFPWRFDSVSEDCWEK